MECHSAGGKARMSIVTGPAASTWHSNSPGVECAARLLHLQPQAALVEPLTIEEKLATRPQGRQRTSRIAAYQRSVRIQSNGPTLTPGRRQSIRSRAARTCDRLFAASDTVSWRAIDSAVWGIRLRNPLCCTAPVPIVQLEFGKRLHVASARPIAS